MGYGEARAYDEVATALLAEGGLGDAWVDGAPRFSLTPDVLSAADFGALSAAAEAVAALHDEGVRLCLADPALRARYLPLSPVQELLWQSSGGRWHGLARADVFFTDGGLQVCELNSDTPSGEPEAVILNAAAQAQAMGLIDPNRELGARWVELIETVAGRSSGITLGLCYPTELVEDLAMIKLYAGWARARGIEVVLGSPYNLVAVGDGVGMFGRRCDVIWRHYKTDWWTERVPVWDDEPPPSDHQPLVRPLALLLSAEARRQVAVLNPFGSVLTQNKRMLALLWEERARLSEAGRLALEKWVPPTVRLETLPADAARVDWVLKSDFGCEGAEVLVGAEVDEAVWAAARRHALPRRWIAQRRFVARLDQAGSSHNHGVYVLAGRTAGVFTRVQRGATDERAVNVPTLVEGCA